MTALRLLIDNALSPGVCEALVEAGYEAVHVGELGLATASDQTILRRAVQDDRIVVSRDSDFARLLATSSATLPSVVVLRGEATMKPVDQASTLLRYLPRVADQLRGGAIVTLDGTSVRVRALPLV